MYALTNTRTKISDMQYNLYLKTDFLGCFETLEEAQEAVTRFAEKVEDRVSNTTVCSYGDLETYVKELHRQVEYVNNLQIHVVN